MRGAWLTSMASRLLREPTFRLIAAPAIADLQFEGGARHYVAIWRVIVRALLHDFRVDIATVFGSSARVIVWPKTIALFWLLFIVMTVSRLGDGLLRVEPDGTAHKVPLPALGDGLEPIVAGIVVSVALTAAGYATLGLIFALRRRHASVRAVVVAAFCISALTYGAARTSRPITTTADLYRAAATTRDVWYPKTEPLAAIIADEIVPSRARFTAARADIWRHITTSKERQSALNVLVFALLGATLARGRGWGVLLRFVGIMATQALLLPALPYLHLLLWPIGSPQPSPSLAMLPALTLLPLVTAAFLAFDLSAARRRSPSCAS